MALICAGLVKLLFVARDRLLSWQKGFDLIASASGRAALRPVRAEATRSVAVTVRGVSHAFDLAGTKLPVLDSIDLSVAAGEFIALLGPSGYGKSNSAAPRVRS